MSGLSPIELIRRWADRAAKEAAGGAVCEENLRAILGPAFSEHDVWGQAISSFNELLRRLKAGEAPLVQKLIVPLSQTATLDLELPDLSQVMADLDPMVPPSLVIHPPLVRRGGEPFEEYRRPLTTELFVDERGQSLAQGTYVAFRDRWEIQDGADYRRQLLFERFPDD